MTNNNEAITQLKRLKKPMGKLGKTGLKARIDFFCTAVGSGLKQPLTQYEPNTNSLTNTALLNVISIPVLRCKMVAL